MKKIRLFAACLVCRLTRSLLHLLGRGGTNLPGALALRLCPDILAIVARGVDTILVTGTNGKTTTVKMIHSALESLGQEVLTNRSGANLVPGITAEYVLNATLGGQPRRRCAVIECDEAHLKHVSAALAPRVLVVTNIFRDQLDRYGDVSQTLAEIREGVKRAPDALLCLNADCSLTASLAEDTGHAALYFGAEVSGAQTGTVSDAPRCLRCGSRYEYGFHTFAHLGDFRCPDCGYRRPQPQLAVLSVENSGEGSLLTFRHKEERFTVASTLPSLYNAYNAAAALLAVQGLGFDMLRAAPFLSQMEAGFGRMETMTVGGTPVRFILVKNPAGCDRALEYLATLPHPWCPVFCLNDTPSDGTDISWLWDSDFESFVSQAQPALAGVYGSRAEELRLRLKYAGMDDGTIRCFATNDELLAFVKASEIPVYVLPNYSSMLDVRDKLSCASGGRRFWN